MKEEQIKEALNRNVDLSTEEYEENFKKACDCANGNIGTMKKVSEATKHKRIQSNFYGSSINYLSAMYDELCRLNDMLAMAMGLVEPKDKEENK